MKITGTSSGGTITYTVPSHNGQPLFGWLDIESAPQDGTRIMILRFTKFYDGQKDYYRILHDCFWENGKWFEETCSSCSMGPDEIESEWKGGKEIIVGWTSYPPVPQSDI